MRDFASCFTEHAVRVSDSSCSGAAAARPASSTASITSRFSDIPSIPSTVSCLYRTNLANLKHQLLINVTWSKTNMDPKLSIDDGRKTTQLVLRGPSGRQSTSLISLDWDLSSAIYGPGPEPVSGFYIAVSTVDSELAFLLGEMPNKHLAEEPLVLCRREQVLGSTTYSTKARFRVSGVEHDISIRCRGDPSELTVCVDRRRVVHVRRLEYNFRGNQTLFVDGSPVDLMWDVHGWLFGGGFAVFMFRARSALESRLWLEEEMLSKEKGEACFSLVIQAFKGGMRTADL